MILTRAESAGGELHALIAYAAPALLDLCAGRQLPEDPLTVTCNLLEYALQVRRRRRLHNYAHEEQQLPERLKTKTEPANHALHLTGRGKNVQKLIQDVPR
jgi:hypothetical protein